MTKPTRTFALPGARPCAATSGRRVVVDDRMKAGHEFETYGGAA
jgi:hypothetical protein